GRGQRADRRVRVERQSAQGRSARNRGQPRRCAWLLHPATRPEHRVRIQENRRPSCKKLIGCQLGTKQSAECGENRRGGQVASAPSVSNARHGLAAWGIENLLLVVSLEERGRRYLVAEMRLAEFRLQLGTEIEERAHHRVDGRASPMIIP